MTKEAMAKFREYKKRDRENAGRYEMKHANTSVYINKSLIREFIKEYEDEVASSETMRKMLPATISEETAEKRIKVTINHHWYPIKSVSEYTEYKNAITGEKRRHRHWGK